MTRIRPQPVVSFIRWLISRLFISICFQFSSVYRVVYSCRFLNFVGTLRQSTQVQLVCILYIKHTVMKNRILLHISWCNFDKEWKIPEYRWAQCRHITLMTIDLFAEEIWALLTYAWRTQLTRWSTRASCARWKTATGLSNGPTWSRRYSFTSRTSTPAWSWNPVMMLSSTFKWST